MVKVREDTKLLESVRQSYVTESLQAKITVQGTRHGDVWKFRATMQEKVCHILVQKSVWLIIRLCQLYPDNPKLS